MSPKKSYQSLNLAAMALFIGGLSNEDPGTKQARSPERGSSRIVVPHCARPPRIHPRSFVCYDGRSARGFGFNDSAEKLHECFDQPQHERKISNDLNRSSDLDNPISGPIIVFVKSRFIISV